MNDLNESMALTMRESEQLDQIIKKLNDEAGLRRFLPKNLGGISPGEEIEPTKERRKEVEREIEEINDQIRISRDNLECIDTRIAGGTCDSLMDKISNAGKAGISALKEIGEKVNNMVTNITMLVIAVVIENILFPILFLMGAVKCCLPVARLSFKVLSGFERDSRELKDMMKRQKDPAQKLERHDSHS